MKNKKHQSRWMIGYIRCFLFSLQIYNRFYKFTSRFTKKQIFFLRGNIGGMERLKGLVRPERPDGIPSNGNGMVTV